MPTYIFGEGPTATVSGTHKDTSFYDASPNNALAAQPAIYCGQNAAGTLYYGSLRFDISSIPAGETVTSATLDLYLTAAPASDLAVELYAYTVAWGVDDTNEGPDGLPAVAGQATYAESKDSGGVGDVGWAGANFATGADTDAAPTDLFTIAALDPAGTKYSRTLTTLVSNWHTGAKTNNGIVLVPLLPVGNMLAQLDSQESATAAERPALTVVTVAGGGATGSSVARQKSSTSVGIGIGV